jgi:hypothetical protein
VAPTRPPPLPTAGWQLAAGRGLGESAPFYGHLVGEVVRGVDDRSLGAALREEVRYTVVAAGVERTPTMGPMGCQSFRVPSRAGQGRG